MGIAASRKPPRPTATKASSRRLSWRTSRNGSMRERAIKAQNEAKHQMDAYIREQAGGSPADELHKLNELKEKGALSTEEFEKAKAKLLA